MMEILLKREDSSMASAWTEMLAINQLANGNWCLHTCQNEIIGSVDDIDDKNKKYDENGELIIPDVIDGKNVFGLSDGYYFLGEEILEGDPSIEFSKDNKDAAIEFMIEELWDQESDYDKAIQRLHELIGD